MAFTAYNYLSRRNQTLLPELFFYRNFKTSFLLLKAALNFIAYDKFLGNLSKQVGVSFSASLT